MFERLLPWHVVLLCIASGSLDAVTVLAVGDAFASVMTGNFILLGVAAGGPDLLRVLACITAIGGYVVGGFGGSWWTRRRPDEGEEALWPRRVTETFAVEGILLLVAAVAWALFSEKAGTALTMGLLFMAAMAMGMQSAAVRSIGVPVATTYMTGTLSGIAEVLAQRTRFSSQHRHGLYGLAALLTGAVAGGVLVTTTTRAALFLPVAAVSAVVVSAFAAHRRGR